MLKRVHISVLLRIKTCRNVRADAIYFETSQGEVEIKNFQFGKIFSYQFDILPL